MVVGGLSAADHKRLVKMREIEHAQTRKKERAKGRGALVGAVALARTGAKLSTPEPALQGTRAASSQRTPVQTEAAPFIMPSKRTMVIALTRARNQAGRSHEMATLNRLCTSEGASAFVRQRRMRAYGRLQSNVNGVQAARDARRRQNAFAAEQEIATQTETVEEAAAAAELMASDEQALDDLAQADLAYLQMVRHKMGHTGALTSSAENLLAESWQQLIMLRLESQKLQLRQQAQPMTTADMERVESEISRETARIGHCLQQQLAQLMPSQSSSDTHTPGVMAPPLAPPLTRGASTDSDPIEIAVEIAPGSKKGEGGGLPCGAGTNGGARRANSGAASEHEAGFVTDASAGSHSPEGSTPRQEKSHETANGVPAVAAAGVEAAAAAELMACSGEIGAAHPNEPPTLMTARLATARPTRAAAGSDLAPWAMAAAAAAELPSRDGGRDARKEAPRGGRTVPSSVSRLGAGRSASAPCRARPSARRALRAANSGAGVSATRGFCTPDGSFPSRAAAAAAASSGTVAVPVRPVTTLKQTIVQMERELKKEDGNLSKLRAKLNDLTRDNGSARVRGSQRALESLYDALQHSHSELDALQAKLALISMQPEATDSPRATISPHAGAAARRRRNSREGRSPRAVSHPSSSSQAMKGVGIDAKSWWRHRRLPIGSV